MGLKAYLRGFIPCLVWVIIFSVSVSQGSAKLVFSWWTVYVVISYIVCFPRGYRWLTGRMRQEKNPAKPLKNADQEALRLGATYANTGKFGTARIGDTGSKEGWLTRVGTNLVAWLFLVVAGPLVLGLSYFKK
ncbi:hypothetical protein [Levilactobacillus fujinensis]|uniref:DUF3899 domain-containing protein n=1 Tax=Levilactobacillus fujinensis TaxID=2486024 RepID=A0ABW1TKF6_9LACO|nr:hypothetical protein [Levilactobacillus fujinensis]